jgi:hypothetical protein
MPVVSMMRMEGDPDELVASIRQLDSVAEGLAMKHGGLLHIVARDGDRGVLVINVWETDEGRHAMAEEPEIQEAIRAAGLPAPHFEAYPIETLRVSDQAVAAATPQ